MQKLPYFSELLNKAAISIGAEIIFEENFGYAGKIIFDNKKISFFKTTSFDINSFGASEIAKDKQYTKYFLEKSGYNVPLGDIFFSDELNVKLKNKKTIFDGLDFAKKIGFPVILKPNNLLKGNGVAKVWNESQFADISNEIFKLSPSMIVEEYVSGNDYRILVLGDEILQVFQREHLAIIGNGKNTIKELIDIKQQYIFNSGRKEFIDINDIRIKQNLENNNFDLHTILEENYYLRLLDCANLFSGGNSVNFIDKVHPDYKKLAINITNDMGLTLCGVDIITQDISKPLSEYKILEINSAPGIDNYLLTKEELTEIYKKILLKIKNKI